MLQTRVGKRTGAAALRMAVDMTKGTGAKGPIAVEDLQDRGADARRRRAPRPGAAPAVRRHRPDRHREGPRRVAGRGRRQGVLHCRRRSRRRPSAARTVILVRNETSPEDVHGMMVAAGHPHLARRPRQPCRCRRSRVGHPGDRRCRLRSRSTASSSRSAAYVVNEGDDDLARRHHRRGHPRRVASLVSRGAAGRSSTRSSSWADGPQGQAGRAGQRRHRARGRHQRPHVRRRGHRAVPHRAHVPRGPTACRSCAG